MSKPTLSKRLSAIMLCAALASGFLAAGCGGDGGGGLSNDDPGDNNLNVVMAFGDSLTAGEEKPAYPSILSGLIGKNVTNDGIYGSTAASGAGRCSSVIANRKGAFMLILYGVNDILRGVGGNAVASLDSIITTCKNNHVVPVLATYPVPTKEHKIYASEVQRLNRSIRDLASQHGITCVDLEQEFDDRDDPDDSLYMEDGLHPNAAGNQIMALAFADIF